jgi:hypothetical protein
MNQQNENKNQPAFPPQVAQDNFGRLVVAVPGMTKREFFSIMMLNKALEISFQRKIVMNNGKEIDAFQAAIYWADQLLLNLEKTEENETTTKIIK